MSREPKDTPEQPKSSVAAQSARQQEPSASTETVADIVRRKIANNPRFKEVKDVFVGDHTYEQFEGVRSKHNQREGLIDE